VTRRTYHRLRRLRLAALALLRDAGPLCLWQVCHRLGRMRGTFIAFEGVEVALRTLVAWRLAARCSIDIETAGGPATATGWMATTQRDIPRAVDAAVTR
jgi:hypothetical protein